MRQCGTIVGFQSADSGVEALAQRDVDCNTDIRLTAVNRTDQRVRNRNLVSQEQFDRLTGLRINLNARNALRTRAGSSCNALSFTFVGSAGSGF